MVNLEKPPFGAPQCVRKWRSTAKAHNNPEITAHRRKWLGIRSLEDDQLYRVKRLPFGLNGAGKALSTVLEHVLGKDVFLDKHVGYPSSCDSWQKASDMHPAFWRDMACARGAFATQRR